MNEIRLNGSTTDCTLAHTNRILQNVPEWYDDNIIKDSISHYNDVTRTSWRLKSTAIGLFVRKLVEANKKPIKAPITCICWGNPPVIGGFPTQMASDAGSFDIVSFTLSRNGCSMSNLLIEFLNVHLFILPLYCTCHNGGWLSDVQLVNYKYKICDAVTWDWLIQYCIITHPCD